MPSNKPRTIQERMSAKAQLRPDMLRALDLAAKTFLSDPYLCLEHAERAANLAHELNESRALAEAERWRGRTYARLAQYPIALEHLENARRYFQKEGDYHGVISCMVTIGGIHGQLTNYNLALDTLEHGLELCEQHPYSEREGLLVNIALIWMFLGDLERAEATFEETLALTKISKNRDNEALALGNLAFTKMRRLRQQSLDDLEKAELTSEIEELALTSSALAQELGDVRVWALSFEILGDIEFYNGNFDAAMHYAKRQLELGEQLGNLSILGIGHLQIGKIQDVLGHDKAALEAFERCLQALGQVQTFDRIAESYQALAQFHARRAQFQAAYNAISEQVKTEQTVRYNAAQRYGQALEHRLELSRAQRQAERDPLTGLYNRRGFRKALETLSMAQIGVVMLDIDHFKKVNDTFGHALGDAVLFDLAQILRHNCRPGDVIARVGGEEFALLLPNSHDTNIFDLCERLRRAVNTFDWSAINPNLNLTISLGWVNASSLQSDQDTLERIQYALEKADQQLYIAKNTGRNRVEPQLKNERSSTTQ
jgi:diguanylate cyclase (GGDEF)-like protein